MTDTHFAVITARGYVPQGDYRTHYKTCGHADPNCPAIRPDSRRLPTTTLGEHLRNNEFFDGEVVYLSPFRCNVCHHDLCHGGTCTDVLSMCSKHSAAYQRRYGRAPNE